jgi:putative Holliday junction resolvase
LRILAVDYGEARTGLAVSDFTGTIASPLTVIHEKNMDSLVKKIVQAVSENDAREVVVGNPINMNGSKGNKSEKCELLAEKLRWCLASENKADLPVEMWDERLTTVAAHEIINANSNAHRGDKSRHRRNTSAEHRCRGSVVDSIAAALILEGYLGFRKNKA